jgi:hypothetical protein
VDFNNFAYGIAGRALATQFPNLQTMPADLALNAESFSAFAGFLHAASSLYAQSLARPHFAFS